MQDPHYQGQGRPQIVISMLSGVELHGEVFSYVHKGSTTHQVKVLDQIGY